jgi:hypothetical protein
MSTIILCSIAAAIAIMIFIVLWLEMQKCQKQSKAVENNLQVIYDSCNEGMTGEWDCSDDYSRRNGFEAIMGAVVETATFLNLHISERG